MTTDSPPTDSPPIDLTKVEVPDNLDEVLREAVKREMTPEEKRAQRVSWIMGMRHKDSTATREEVQQRIDAKYR